MVNNGFKLLNPYKGALSQLVTNFKSIFFSDSEKFCTTFQNSLMKESFLEIPEYTVFYFHSFKFNS
jgi:hypothetical protein